MSALNILEEVIDRKAREKAIDILSDISGNYYQLSFETPRVKMKFKNKRLKEKWYRSMAASIRAKIKRLK